MVFEPTQSGSSPQLINRLLSMSLFIIRCIMYLITLDAGPPPLLPLPTRKSA